MLAYNELYSQRIKAAKEPDLSEPCCYTKEQFTPGLKSLGDLDELFLRNKVAINFKVEDLLTGANHSYSFNQQITVDKKSIGYFINSIPIIIKPIEYRYKTLRGCISGLYSATRSGQLLSSSGNVLTIKEVIVCAGLHCYRAFLSGEHAY